MRHGERQVAPDISGIRRDHVARYRWAATLLPRNSKVIDVGCGVGYGAFILAEAGHQVVALDIDPDAIWYAKQHYGHPNIQFRCAPADYIAGYEPDAFDAATCFEMVEHVADPLPILRALGRVAKQALVSVPNEDAFPYTGQAFHFRHYRPQEFADLLASAGLGVDRWFGQRGRESDVEPNRHGRTLVAVARCGAAGAPPPVQSEPSAAPAHVVILGLGPSLERYVDITKRLGARAKLADEVWGINAVGDVIRCDRIFHMDDVRIQEIRAAARPESNIAAMLQWMRRHPGPIYTSRPHPDYPGLVEFPLEDVINACTTDYFNGTCAYAVAFAIHLGVKKISLFGCDFTYPNAHDAERGRACVEFWLGLAWARGIDIVLPEQTSLMDANVPEGETFYGYDTRKVIVEHDASGRAVVRFEQRDTIPTADEIERRYDHSAHPNLLARSKAP